MADRGQTPHDYLIGVSLMLVVLFGIFAFVPGIFQPFQEPVGTEETTMADSVADRLVSTHAAPGAANTLEFDRLRQTLTVDSEFETVLDRSGFPRDLRQVNVTVAHPNGSRLSVGPPASAASDYYVNRSTAARSIRIVRFTDEDRCEPVCRLIVRVW